MLSRLLYIKEEYAFLRKIGNKRIFIISILMLIVALVTVSIHGNPVHASGEQKGLALKSSTNVYESTSTNSKVLKSYTAGSILLYKSYSANWYSATVILNGKGHSGYIHKSDVENSISVQETLKGIGLINPTAVFAQASTSSKKLKTYSVGSILTYKTFSGNWYEAVVYINGKRTTGYIHKSHVESKLNLNEGLKGIGVISPTAVYSRASTSAPKLKTYSQGSKLTYRTFSDNWYEATVYINGKATIGYIAKTHVDGVVDKQDNLRGIGLQSSTSVYARASTGSKKLKSYSQGTILSYKTFTTNWYEAVVYINGKRTTGYIHSSHVEGISSKSQSLDGMSLKSPTNVYSRASKNASVLRSYPAKRYLLFKTMSPNWYEATVILNGKRTTGYIHANDVSTDKVSITTTSYSTSFNRVVDIQMTRTPKSDGAGNIAATRSQVEYYANPSNFNKNSTDYYQFLVLSEPAGLQVNEINQKVLNNHGKLTGHAKSFIDAGKKFNINEAYLIAHALHETGNGASVLARGVPVDNKGNVVAANKAVHTVYNMYGIGAVDSNALKGGAKRAFDEGWFTPEEAIIGGAQFINTYIARGQDTLYKMRWNPVSPGHPQYATHVAWATIQTVNISKIYDLLDNYVLIYDVPKYANQPSSSGNPNNYNKNVQSTMSLFRSVIESPNDNGETNEILETPEVDEPVELEEIPESEETVDSNNKTEPEDTQESEEPSKVDEEVEIESGESSEEVEQELEVDEEVEEEVNEEEIEEEVNQLEEIQIFGVSSDDLELNAVPNDLDSTVTVTIPEGTKLEITAIDGTWYETNYEGEIGWVDGDSVTLLNLLEVIVDKVDLYEEPNNSNDPIATVELETFLAAVLSEDDTIIQEDEWVQVLYNDEKLWIHTGENSIEYIEFK